MAIANDAGADKKSDAEWKQGISLYQSGQLKEALQVFKEHPSSDAAYFYNLGTLLTQLGDIGQGVAYLEKANRLEPHNPTTQHNLRLARKELAKRIGNEQLDSASSWIETIADRVPIEEVRGTLGLLGCVVVLLWIRSYLSTRRLRQTLLQPAAILSMLGLLVTIALYGMERYSEAHPPGFLMEKSVVRSGPGDHFLELAQVPVGSKVRILSNSPTDGHQESNEKWFQVRYSTSSVGWIKASSLLLL